MTVCNDCGLPEELCVCEDMAKGESEIVVSVEERKYNKQMTVISGFDDSRTDIDSLSSELKSEMACGGKTETEDGEGVIYLQGDHTEKSGSQDNIMQSLSQRGFEVTLSSGDE